jgi:hypothetical protein
LSKTYRHFPEEIVRKPKGHKWAVINGARKGAIPPSSWEDQPIDAEAYIPYNAAERMYTAGILPSVIVSKLRTKYRLTQRQAEEVVNSVIEYI